MAWQYHQGNEFERLADACLPDGLSQNINMANQIILMAVGQIDGEKLGAAGH